jgi:hypothetical protein
MKEKEKKTEKSYVKQSNKPRHSRSSKLGELIFTETVFYFLMTHNTLGK